MIRAAINSTYDDRTTQIQFAADQKLIGVTSGNSEIALATEYPHLRPLSLMPKAVIAIISTLMPTAQRFH